MKNKKIITKIVVASLIFRNNKVLIIRRSASEKIFPGMWELPSGKKNDLESVDLALVRETKEEVNLNVEIIIPFHIFDYQIEQVDEIRDSVQISFLVKEISQLEVKISKGHQGFKWISLEELDNYNASKNTKEIIKRAFEIYPLFIR